MKGKQGAFHIFLYTAEVFSFDGIVVSRPVATVKITWTVAEQEKEREGSRRWQIASVEHDNWI